jgi:hypothetical protein
MPAALISLSLILIGAGTLPVLHVDGGAEIKGHA